MKSIAIIGAGLAGLTLARQLQEDADITIFEKSRGFGGRMATRRVESYEFDHGAQFFTARSEDFQQFLVAHIADNLVSQWQPKVITLETEQKRYKREWFEPHYVAAPGMSALCKGLALGLNVKMATEIRGVTRAPAGWRLENKDRDKFGPYDWVISSVPAPQASALLPDCFADESVLRRVHFWPCFSLMLGFKTHPALHFDAAVVRNSAISWLAINSSKVNRGPDFAMVIHSDSDWAQSHIDSDSEEIQRYLLETLQDLLGDSLPQPHQQDLHLWRFAKTKNAAGMDFLLDQNNQLAACGEWCRGNRVEDAYLSGLELGKKLLTLL